MNLVICCYFNKVQFLANQRLFNHAQLETWRFF